MGPEETTVTVARLSLFPQPSTWLLVLMRRPSPANILRMWASTSYDKQRAMQQIAATLGSMRTDRC